VVTLHRRENQGEPLERICRGLNAVVARFKGLSLVAPLHPNPRVRAVLEARLGGHDRIALTEPLDYPTFVALMKASAGILTDSGGIQEEAPALGKPVLVLRETTERRSSRPWPDWWNAAFRPTRGRGTAPRWERTGTRMAMAGPRSGSPASSRLGSGSTPARHLRGFGPRGPRLLAGRRPVVVYSSGPGRGLTD
jgi:hypothetical protein